MLMRGDINKIIEQVNLILEDLRKKVDALEDQVKDLKSAQSTPSTTKVTKSKAA